MKWLEITVTTSREFADIVSLKLIEAGSEGTVIKDNADIKDLLSSGIIWDYVDEHLLQATDPRVFVSGFFALGSQIAKITESLMRLKTDTDLDVGSFEISVREIDSLDWENEWKKYYCPIEFSTFAIVPEWIKCHGIKDKKIILLNPGMAFGTGSHETTSMCLKLMEGLSFENKSVIDLGCGSGILGITAALLGAKETLLTDIDPYAVKCACENAQLNALNNSLSVLKANLLNETLDFKADILLANLTAPLLLNAREGIKKHLSPGGVLIVSGILKEYDVEVLEAYSCDFDIITNLSNGEWQAHMLSLKR